MFGGPVDRQNVFPRGFEYGQEVLSRQKALALVSTVKPLSVAVVLYFLSINLSPRSSVVLYLTRSVAPSTAHPDTVGPVKASVPP